MGEKMLPKPVGKTAIIANDFAFGSQMELEVCNQLFCLLPPVKRHRNGEKMDMISPHLNPQ